MITANIGALALILLDIISGMIKAIKVGNWSSKALKNGLLSKAGFIILIILANIFKVYQPSLGIELPIDIVVAINVYISILEVSSIIENIAEIAPEIKKTKLLQMFNITNSDEKENKK